MPYFALVDKITGEVNTQMIFERRNFPTWFELIGPVESEQEEYQKYYCIKEIEIKVLF